MCDVCEPIETQTCQHGREIEANLVDVTAVHVRQSPCIIIAEAKRGGSGGGQSWTSRGPLPKTGKSQTGELSLDQ